MATIEEWVEKCDETGEDAHKVTNVAKNLQVHKYLVVNSGHLAVVHLTSVVIILVRGKYFKVIWKAFFRIVCCNLSNVPLSKVVNWLKLAFVLCRELQNLSSQQDLRLMENEREGGIRKISAGSHISMGKERTRSKVNLAA
ncbi:hypothetical protein CCACVL1_15599 [Corchorus capsularis]|uniref:Uncharacterized protein n=1 Tax=Corchorus capsularis TaxID=210143 RepID=A0A1R3I1W9_COCAP|nr:hypothetical protein CCACVL1_15599 [Corchorus capsularis]